MTTLWLDIESGTYFSAPPMTIHTDKWSEQDWIAWEETMSDSDRTAWGEHYLSTTNLTSPSDWCNPEHEVVGWPYA